MQQSKLKASLMTIPTLTLLLAAWVSAQDDLPSPEPPPDTHSLAVGDIEFETCERSAYQRQRRVECAQFSVPENRAEPEGRAITLDIVRLPARNARTDTAPILALAGGPGQAATESFLFLDQMLRDAGRQHDIYLIDQRGTGGSAPLQCDLSEAEAMLTTPDDEAMRALAAECLADLSADPTHYTTSVAVQDFEAVREALALEQWQLYAVSYGTRVAQHYLRQYPQSVRTATLDSVLPMELNLGPDIALQSQQALDRFLGRCDADPACQKAFPDLRSGLHNLLEALEDNPQTVSMESIRSGERTEQTLTHAHLAGLIRLGLYQTEMLATLPPMLHQAYAHDNFGPLARTAFDQAEELVDAMAMGMHNAVVCTEDVPFYDIDDSTRARINQSYLGDLVLRSLEATCEVWPAGAMDPDFKAPLQSDVPILLISGEHDPITPPAYADSVLHGLSNGRHLIAPGQGHMASIRGCMPTLIAQFLQDGSSDGLNTECLDRLHPAPLMINFNGPSP